MKETYVFVVIRKVDNVVLGVFEKEMHAEQSVDISYQNAPERKVEVEITRHMLWSGTTHL